MKKTSLILLTILILTLTACGSAPTTTGPGSGSQSGASTGELSAATQLIVGTLKLDGTAQAVTAKQAQELLPLWQTLLVLTNSDTAADQEKEALIAQIQETMTAEQRQAIADMNLSRQDMMSILQRQGMGMGGSSQNNDSQGRNSFGGRNFGPGGGGPPEGMPGGGPGGFGGGQNLSQDQIATAQAARQQSSSENFIPPMLLNAVIEYLQKTAGS